MIEEAADDDRWALIGASACRLQGCESQSPNLEFITTVGAVQAISDMLGVPTSPGHGMLVDAERLHFLRRQVPVFLFGAPVFHGNYDALSPIDIPSLWDARVRVDTGTLPVLVTPLEWELLLAVVLGSRKRADEVSARLRERGYDGRLLTRLMREGRVARDTEEAVWRTLEESAAAQG